jgi:hypothetical protein
MTGKILSVLLVSPQEEGRFSVGRSDSSIDMCRVSEGISERGPGTPLAAEWFCMSVALNGSPSTFLVPRLACVKESRYIIPGYASGLKMHQPK